MANLALLLLSLIAAVGGFSTQYRGHTQHPTLDGQCYYEELDLIVPLNGTVKPPSTEEYCVQVHCREDYVLMIRHCDRIMLRHGCLLTPNDHGQQYPECCPRLLCDEER